MTTAAIATTPIRSHLEREHRPVGRHTGNHEAAGRRFRERPPQALDRIARERDQDRDEDQIAHAAQEPVPQRADRLEHVVDRRQGVALGHRDRRERHAQVHGDRGEQRREVEQPQRLQLDRHGLLLERRRQPPLPLARATPSARRASMSVSSLRRARRRAATQQRQQHRGHAHDRRRPSSTPAAPGARGSESPRRRPSERGRSRASSGRPPEARPCPRPVEMPTRWSR